MGTSLICNRVYLFDEDHPHAYGDKFLEEVLVTAALGSSPRVWGQVCFDSISVVLSGIIPTRMGTSVFLRRWKSPQGDHPHAYGDKFKLSTGAMFEYRIIPTRMGTSRTC